MHKSFSPPPSSPVPASFSMELSSAQPWALGLVMGLCLVFIVKPVVPVVKGWPKTVVQWTWWSVSINHDANILRFINPKPWGQPNKLKSQELTNKKMRIYLGFVMHLLLLNSAFLLCLGSWNFSCSFSASGFHVFLLSSAIGLGREGGRCRKCDEPAGEQWTQQDRQQPEIKLSRLSLGWCVWLLVLASFGKLSNSWKFRLLKILRSLWCTDVSNICIWEQSPDVTAVEVWDRHC